MTRRDECTGDLFGDVESPKRREEDCAHQREEKTETDWGPPYGLRLTWTCHDCGRIRGRVR